MVKTISECEETYLKLRNSVKPKHNKQDENCIQAHHNQIPQNSD